MINIEEEYAGLLSGILYGGKNKKDRTGTGTKSVFGRMIYHNMQLGFPLLTTKKIYFNHAITELLWILNGRTDLEYLNTNGVSYWDQDYTRSGRQDGELGPIYGKQWRNFRGDDQLARVVRELKNNPSSRRLLVSAWNPADLDDMVLPPCHHNFQIYVNDGQLDLMWQQRSADVFLGLPYDIAMYGLLLELLAKGINLLPGKLVGSLGDCHLYNNHLEQAKLQLNRKPKALPKIKIKKGICIDNPLYHNGDLFIPSRNDIELIKYNPEPAIAAELSVGN